MEAEVWNRLRAGEPGLAVRWQEIRSLGTAPKDPAAARPDGPLSMGDIERLRQRLGPTVARFASLQEELGRRSRRRFPLGRPLFWTSKGLEQATPAAVAEYRAGRFAALQRDDSVVWDACSGVGSDAAALLRHGCRVLASDWDPETARCAAANLRVEADALGADVNEHRGERRGTPAAWTARCDLRKPPLHKDALAQALILLDPDRRPGGEHREPRPEHWAPSLSATRALARSARGACVKLPPSLDASAEGLDHDPEAVTALEWISLDGEMKELALWVGALVPEALADGSRMATALTSQPDTPAIAQFASDELAIPLPEAWPLDRLQEQAWLVELDPTLWQAELAGAFCEEHGLAPIETELRGMFLVAAAPPASALARSWPILDCVPADRKRVRKLLRERGIGATTVKKRNHPKTSLQLEAEFRGPGEAEGLLAVFRVSGGSMATLLGPEVGSLQDPAAR